MLAQRCVHVLSILCQAQVPLGPSAPGRLLFGWLGAVCSLACYSQVSMALRVGTRGQAYGCGQPWVPRGFWTGRAFMWMPAGLLSPGGARRRESCSEKNTWCLEVDWWEGGTEGQSVCPGEEDRDQWEMRASSTEEAALAETWGGNVSRVGIFKPAFAVSFSLSLIRSSVQIPLPERVALFPSPTHTPSPLH